MNVAVTREPDRVNVVAYLLDGHRPSEIFFELMFGAAEEFARLFGLPDGSVTMQSNGRQAHFVFEHPRRGGISGRLRGSLSRFMYTVYTLAVIRSSYPELVMGRKLFEEQLVKSAKLQSRLSSTERAFERRMAYVDDVIAEIDSGARLIYVSPNLQRIVGVSATNLLERPTRVVHPDDVERVTRGVTNVLARRGTDRIEDFRVTDVEGQTRWVEMAFSTVTTPEGPSHLLAVARDVTGRRRHIEEQRHLDKQLETTQRLETLGVMAGGIAHDFNNLLAPILGQADLARAHLSGHPKLAHRLDSIIDAADKASELVRQLMVYAGTESASITTVDLSRETRGLLELIKTGFSPQVVLDLDLAADACVHGDVAQLRQVIMNLIVNASEAIGDQPGHIAVSLVADEHDVILTVRDDGCGMDAVTYARIFEPFFTTKFTGRGLGLSAVRSIGNAHDGELAFETKPGRGTEVKMTLKRVARGASMVPAPEGTVVERSGTVLVVDDEEPVRQVVQQMLERLGYDVEVACDGSEAVTKLDSGPFAAFVVDLTMPKIDGREVLAATRQRYPRVPFIMVSGYGMEQLADDPHMRVLSKPFRVKDLEVTLDELMESDSEPTHIPAVGESDSASGNVS